MGRQMSTNKDTHLLYLRSLRKVPKSRGEKSKLVKNIEFNATEIYVILLVRIQANLLFEEQKVFIFSKL
jgi:hypothetical protein